MAGINFGIALDQAADSGAKTRGQAAGGENGNFLRFVHVQFQVNKVQGWDSWGVMANHGNDPHPSAGPDNKAQFTGVKLGLRAEHN